jgi:hypothetical protein
MKKNKLIFFLIFLISSKVVSKTISEKITTNYSQGLKVALVPWMKERLHESNSLREQYNLLQEQILLAGSQHFEMMSESELKKHRSEPVAYILGKKLFHKGRYYEAEKYLEDIRRSSTLYPHAQYILGTIAATAKNVARAESHFLRCLEEGKRWQNDYDGPEYVNKQFKMLRELCQVGLARNFYNNGKLTTSELKFMELDKRSRIWPSILMDEAWLHFYLGNFNRTLGKIVTFNAPQLKFATHSDLSPLAAYSYLKMCLYNDVITITEKYEKETSVELNDLSEILRNPYQSNSSTYQNIKKHPSFYFYLESMKLATLELSKIRRSGGPDNGALQDNLDDFMDFQNKVIARQMKRLAEKRMYDLRQTLESLSYLKLEVLGKKKDLLYKGKNLKGVRGDVKYLKRNQKQYFWDFAGEFWADELGDYVFALATECQNG